MIHFHNARTLHNAGPFRNVLAGGGQQTTAKADLQQKSSPNLRGSNP
ncbi:hypothetical protein [Stieleria sp. JC731]|nr:hypothetical protein [Stieleria sp. JC731]